MTFYLVQRLTRKAAPKDEPSPFAPAPAGAKLFDATFGCDYMGSSEFEWGAIPAAYATMSALPLQVYPREITRDRRARTVYFIASDLPTAYEDWYDADWDHTITSFDQALELFEAWFSQPRLRAKETTLFDTAWHEPSGLGSYSQEDIAARSSSCTVAWWAIGDHIAWTLDEAIAQDLLAAFTPALVDTDAPR